MCEIAFTINKTQLSIAQPVRTNKGCENCFLSATASGTSLYIELCLCSEGELTSCSLQVLSAAGSPGRTLLARLADRSCSLDFLLHCLRKMNHQEAVQYLTTAGKDEKT